MGLAAYMTGEDMKDERTGKWCTRNHSGEVLDWGTTAPSNAPAFLTDDTQIAKAWNAVEASELRINSHVANHWNLASSREFSEADHVAVAEKIARAITERYNVMVTWAVHKPTDHGDDRNWHIHIGYNMRRIDEDGFGAKAREITAKETRVVETIWQRKLFASAINDRLELIGSEERVSHETYAKQGVDRDPTKHLGSEQHQLQLQGVTTMFGEENRAIRERNAERTKLKVEHAAVIAEIIDLETERQRRGGTGAMSDDLELQPKPGSRIEPPADVPAAAATPDHTSEDQAKRQQEQIAQLHAEQEKIDRDRKARAEELDEFERKRRREIEQADHNKRNRAEDDLALSNRGAPADAHSRYAASLSASNTSSDVYTVLSAAARAEHAAFSQKQDWYREREANEPNPMKRELLRADRHIEWYEYRELTDQRIASYSVTATRNADNPEAVFRNLEAEACKANADQLREYRSKIVTEVLDQTLGRSKAESAIDGRIDQMSAEFKATHKDRVAAAHDQDEFNQTTERSLNRMTQGTYTREDLKNYRERLNGKGEAIADTGTIAEGFGKGQQDATQRAGPQPARPANHGRGGR